MMGLDPDEVLPGNRIRKRMERLVGDYATYRKLETLRVYERNGLLYMGDGEKEPGTPLVPDDPGYESLKFHTLSEGLSSPIEFKVRDDGGLDLLVERSVFHRQD